MCASRIVSDLLKTAAPTHDLQSLMLYGLSYPGTAELDLSTNSPTTRWKNDDDNFRVTNLRGLRPNGRKVSGYTEYEVFYPNKVVWADAGGFINQEHDVCLVPATH